MVVSNKGEKIKVIESKVEKQSAQPAGEPAMPPYESHMVPADDTLERKLTAQLHTY